MNKATFLQALEAGLAAATPEERTAAMQYYTEYLDEAGPEHEAEALAQLGSPEKVAADILGSPQPTSGWTPPAPPVYNSGWNPPEAPRAPEPPPQWREGAASYDQMNAPQYPYGSQNPYGQPQNIPQNYNQRNNSIAKIIVIVMAVIFLSPVLLGVGGTLLGLLFGLLTLLVVPIIVGIALLGSGVLVVISGGFLLAPFLSSGLVAMGIGVSLVGLGLLSIYAGVILLSKMVPAVIRGTGSAIGGLWSKFTSLVSGRA